jgi:hypothetical protein
MRIHNNLNWELVIADLTRCCALAASGQVTAVPMSAAMNSRLATSIAMRPSNGSHPVQLQKRYHPSNGKSVTYFKVPRGRWNVRLWPMLSKKSGFDCNEPVERFD